MPAVESAAARYARAVFALAREAEAEEQFAADIAVAADAFGQPGGVAFLTDRKTPSQRKFAVIDQALAGLRLEVRNLVKVVASKRRAELLPAIRDRFRELWDRERGVVHARVTTAVPLDSAEREAIAGRLSAMTGRRVELRDEVDPGIIGGLIVRIGDTLMDGSTRTRLLALKQRLQGSML